MQESPGLTESSHEEFDELGAVSKAKAAVGLAKNIKNLQDFSQSLIDFMNQLKEDLINVGIYIAEV